AMVRTAHRIGKFLFGSCLLLAAFIPVESAAAAGFRVLHIFANGWNDSAEPQAVLIRDKGGNLYGTTAHGGSNACGLGCGTVFKVAKDGTETTLYTFCQQRQYCTDGEWPAGGLIEDKTGNLYGATAFAGAIGYGTIFKLAPDGTETVLYSFK